MIMAFYIHSDEKHLLRQRRQPTKQFVGQRPQADDPPLHQRLDPRHGASSQHHDAPVAQDAVVRAERQGDDPRRRYVGAGRRASRYFGATIKATYSPSKCA